MNEILADVHSETLEQLLNEVRATTAPFGAAGALALDNSFQRCAKSGSPSSSLNRGDVLEIQGASGSGKTHLLYQLVCSCILPTVHGGWNKAAIVFDTDQCFKIKRLYRLLRSRVGTPTGEQTDDHDVHAVVLASLRNLRIFPAASNTQLAVSILNIPAYHAQHLPTSEIALLAVDSMSAFYWQDRFAAEKRRPRNTMRTQGHLDSTDGPMHHVLVALEKIRITHGPVIVLINWGIHPDDASSPFYRQHLPVFPELPPHTPGVYPILTHRIALHLTATRTLSSETAPATALLQQNVNNAVTEVKGFVMSALSPGIGTFLMHLDTQNVVSIKYDADNMADASMEEEI